MMTMANVFSFYKTNTARETEGVWVKPMGEYEGAPEFKIARAGGANKKFDNLQANLLKPYQRQIQANINSMPEELKKIIQDKNKEAFIATCLLDWRNIENTDAKIIPFSKEQARDLFNQLPDLYTDLFGYAMQIATFQDTEIEAEAGN
jgi:hypothetical protein